MNVKRDSAPTVNKTQDQLQWAAGYYLTPARLAGQRVKSYAAAMVAGLVVAGAAYIGFEYSVWLPMLPAALVAGGATIYAKSVIVDVENVRKQLWLEIWAQEWASGEDIDGDGIVGPPVGHVVPVNGNKNGSVLLPNLDVMERRPLLHFPTGIGRTVTPDDVLHILDRAATEGLAFRSWEGQKLPSGTVLDRSAWGGCLDGLVAWRFAEERPTARGRAVVLRDDITVEDMKRAVRLGAREGQN
jgi:hypothetical protein